MCCIERERLFAVLFVVLSLPVVAGCSRPQVTPLAGAQGELRFSLAKAHQATGRFAAGDLLTFGLTSLSFGCPSLGRVTLQAAYSEAKVTVPIGTTGCDVQDVIVRGGPTSASYHCQGEFSLAGVKRTCTAIDGSGDTLELALSQDVPSPITAEPALLAFVLSPSRTTLSGGAVTVNRQDPGTSVITVSLGEDSSVAIFDVSIDIEYDAATGQSTGHIRVAYQSLDGSDLDAQAYRIRILNMPSGLSIDATLGSFSPTSLSPWDWEVKIPITPAVADYFTRITATHTLSLSLTHDEVSSQYEVRVAPPEDVDLSGSDGLGDLNPGQAEMSLMDSILQAVAPLIEPEDMWVAVAWLTTPPLNLNDTVAGIDPE